MRRFITFLIFIGSIVLGCFIVESSFGEPDNELDGFEVDQNVKSTFQRLSDNDFLQDLTSLDVKIVPEHRHNKKYHTVKHLSVEPLMPFPEIIQHTEYTYVQSLVHNCRPVNRYRFLFYKEINPPPPKMA